MKKYALDGTDELKKQGKMPAQGVQKFDLSPCETDKGRVLVGPFNRPEADKKAVQAYWLPWKSESTSEITVGDEAKFFFTSPLDGCRVYVLGRRVLHVAGDAKLKQIGTNRKTGAPIIKATATEEEDPPEAGVSFRDQQGKEFLKQAEPYARRFSATEDYGEFGFVAGYFKNNMWSFIAQKQELRDGKLVVTGVTPLVGGEI